MMGKFLNFLYVGNSINCGSSIHSRKFEPQALSPGMEIMAHPLISKANITAINPCFNFYPPNVPDSNGIFLFLLLFHLRQR